MVTSMDSPVLDVEIFAAKDRTNLFMSAPMKCGLKEADTLHIDGLSMVAMKKNDILPIDLPQLTPQNKRDLENLYKRGKRLDVAEFAARGLHDSYSLKLVVIL